MFCALNGATRMPFLLNQAQIAVVIQLLPALDDVPPTKIGLAVTFLPYAVERSAKGPTRSTSRSSTTGAHAAARR